MPYFYFLFYCILDWHHLVHVLIVILAENGSKWGWKLTLRSRFVNVDYRTRWFRWSKNASFEYFHARTTACLTLMKFAKLAAKKMGCSVKEIRMICSERGVDVNYYHPTHNAKFWFDLIWFIKVHVIETWNWMSSSAHILASDCNAMKLMCLEIHVIRYAITRIGYIIIQKAAELLIEYNAR